MQDRRRLARNEAIEPVMATRKYFPRWLPPTPEQGVALKRIRSRQRAVTAWWIALIPISWIVIIATRSDALFVPLTIFWIAFGVEFTSRVVEARCPRCGENFCRKTGSPYIYALFNRQCENCGLSLTPDETNRT
jgi:predicted RNA-binding Zn-ribbon protein involved in translation (DUF1610 family)